MRHRYIILTTNAKYPGEVKNSFDSLLSFRDAALEAYQSIRHF